MPKTTQTGKPKRSELPGTLKRSPKKVQRTFAETHETRQELYQQAREAGISGRSNMSKRELARALARKS